MYVDVSHLLEEEDEEHYEPRDGKKPEKKVINDKDMLNMRFKAAQMKRELRSEMIKTEGDVEVNAVNMEYIPITREEYLRLLEAELVEGTDEVDLDELLDRKEAVPEGTSGKMRNKSRTKVSDEPFEIVNEDGEIIEL